MIETLTTTEFKARCLDILDRLGARTLDRVSVTKRGKVMAILTPPETPEQEMPGLYGFMRGSVVIPPGVDLTDPASEEPFDAEAGLLHR